MRNIIRPLCLLGLICLGTAAHAQAPQSSAAKMVSATIAMLTPQQRQSVVFAFDNEAQRRRWSNLPEPMKCGVRSTCRRNLPH